MDKKDIGNIVVRVLALGLGAVLVIAGIVITFYSAFKQLDGFMKPPYMLFTMSVIMIISGSGIYVCDQIIKYKKAKLGIKEKGDESNA